MAQKVRLGEYLVSKGFITEKQLEEVLEQQKKKGGFLGQLLIEKDLVTAADLARALEELSTKADEEHMLGKSLVADNIITEAQLKEVQEKQELTHQRLSTILLELEFATPDEIAKASGKCWGIPYISLVDYEPRPDIMQLIPEEIMRRHKIVPLKLEGEVLIIAMSDPLDILATDEIRLLTNYQIDVRVSSEKEIFLVLDRYFSIQRVAKETLLGTRTEEIEAPAEEEARPEKITHKLEEGPVIKLTDTIIDGGIKAKASDIHLEPQEPEMRVRYRIDGILHDIMNVPKKTEMALISRVKVLADMDIAERRHPQDGHVIVKKGGKEYDIRVSSFATVGGEKIVMRILDRSSMLLGLNELGLSKKDQKIFQVLTNRPYGIILVTGPTGSGKTTTLYAVLNRLNTPTKNTITVEDPVEYKLDGINQSQVNPQAGITFATGLRSILRQDPDVMMVGEIRDLETAEIAIHAALTGHLVLSTLHTNDAPGAITRLIDMGIEPFLISSSVIGIAAQRLVRTICADCKERYSAEPAVLKELGLKKVKPYSLARGKGCQYCLGTGYRGRIAVFELMKISDNLRELINRRVPTKVIRETAIKEGMSTLRQSGLEKVLEGITTPEELKRVIFAEEE